MSTDQLILQYSNMFANMTYDNIRMIFYYGNYMVANVHDLANLCKNELCKKITELHEMIKTLEGEHIAELDTINQYFDHYPKRLHYKEKVVTHMEIDKSKYVAQIETDLVKYDGMLEKFISLIESHTEENNVRFLSVIRSTYTILHNDKYINTKSIEISFFKRYINNESKMRFTLLTEVHRSWMKIQERKLEKKIITHTCSLNETIWSYCVAEVISCGIAQRKTIKPDDLYNQIYVLSESFTRLSSDAVKNELLNMLSGEYPIEPEFFGALIPKLIIEFIFKY